MELEGHMLSEINSGKQMPYMISLTVSLQKQLRKLLESRIMVTRSKMEEKRDVVQRVEIFSYTMHEFGDLMYSIVYFNSLDLVSFSY